MSSQLVDNVIRKKNLRFTSNVTLRYDVVYKPPHDGRIMSVSTLQQAKMFLRENSNGKQGLSMTTFSGGNIVVCEPKYKRAYMGPIGGFIIIL